MPIVCPWSSNLQRNLNSFNRRRSGREHHNMLKANLNSTTWIVILWIVVCTACQAQPTKSTEMNDNKAKDALYPYLGADGRYGYADKDMQVVIPPQYSSAEFFDSNGLAVVQDEGGKYGVINNDNQLLVPFVKERFRLFSVGDQTLIETSVHYTNSLRFWEWQFWPGFSLTGSSTDKRLFDTQVLREKVTLRWLEKNRILKTRRGPAHTSYLRFRIRNLSENKVLIDNDLYKIESSGATKLASNIEEVVDQRQLLQSGSKGYRLVDIDGKSRRKTWLKPITELDLEINGQPDTLVIKKQDNYGLHSKGDFYRDRKNNTVVSTAFDKVFPTIIDEYTHSDTLSARDILDKSRYIAPIPGTDRFMIVLNDLKTLTALDTNGHWHPAAAHYEDFRLMTTSRTHILWPPVTYFLNKKDVPAGWEAHQVAEFDGNELYKISIRRDKIRLQGIWDNSRKAWVLEPEYATLNPLGYAGRFISFRRMEGGKWGIYDLTEQRVHISETYLSITPGGMVQLARGDQRLTFYLDVETRREFRDKPNQ